MTIRIEREAILKVIGVPHSPKHVVSSTCLSSISEPADDVVLLSQCGSSREIWFGDDRIEKIVCTESSEDFPISLKEVDDDTCTTVSSCTESTEVSSTSSTSRGSSVSFCSPLVTAVKTRPRTRDEDVSCLYYSCEEIQSFRQAYREERKADEATTSKNSNPCNNNSNRFLDNEKNIPTIPGHRISRVVVKHNNKHEMFIDEELSKLLDIDPSKLQPLNTFNGEEVKTASDDFFDNDNFWSGQITWY